jgi:hypothetical protein
VEDHFAAAHFLQLGQGVGMVAGFADLPIVERCDLVGADDQRARMAGTEAAFSQARRKAVALGVSPGFGLSSMSGTSTEKGRRRRDSSSRR